MEINVAVAWGRVGCRDAVEAEQGDGNNRSQRGEHGVVVLSYWQM
jgi:hypothetical protein